MNSSFLLSLVFSSLFIQSCRESNFKSNQHLVQEQSKLNKMLNILPDTSINSVLFLNNSSSIQKVFGDVMPLLNKEADLPDLYMFSNSKQEYLRLVFLPGSSKNSISQFEVGYLKKMPKGVKATDSRLAIIVTESNITLGISKLQVIKLKGNDYKEEKNGEETVVEYNVNDFESSVFLKRYNMPSYFAKYWFFEDKLIKFRFGFEYP